MKPISLPNSFDSTIVARQEHSRIPKLMVEFSKETWGRVRDVWQGRGGRSSCQARDDPNRWQEGGGQNRRCAGGLWGLVVHECRGGRGAVLIHRIQLSMDGVACVTSVGFEFCVRLLGGGPFCCVIPP